MSAATTALAAPAATPSAAPANAAQLNRLAAEDLQALAWLHERERTLPTLVELHASGFCQTLSLLAPTHPACVELGACLSELGRLPADVHATCNDDMAVDYAAIYLTHAYRAAPYESVWRDEDHLMMQAPTFEVRAFYSRFGYQVPDWRLMPDDHLAHELLFVAHLLSDNHEREAARFLHTHLMTWLPDWAAQVGKRARTQFYASLAQLTLACVEQCVTRLPKVAVIPAVRSSPTSSCGTATPC
mgnify:FL=1